SPKARAKIRQWFAKERRDEAIETGKERISKEVRKTGLPMQRLISAESVGALAKELNYADISALYAAVGENHTSAKHVVHRVVTLIGGVEEAEDELAERSTPSTGTQRRGSDDVGGSVTRDSEGGVKRARCCTSGQGGATPVRG